MKITPLISVIMSVYNEQEYITEALKSILNQTVQDFEIIIIDDCSTDQTIELIQKFGDNRIRLYQNEENLGLTKNLNKALQYATGKYIARMDGDDISMPERFRYQLAYMQKHPDIMLISCQTETFGDESLVWKLKDDPETLRCMMLVRPVLAHPGFLVRREIFFEYGYRYDESYRQAQDYELVSRITRKFQIGICPHVLLKYRAHKEQVSATATSRQFANADRVRSFLLEELGIHWNEEQIAAYHKLILEEHTEKISDFVKAKDMIQNIFKQNEEYAIYNQSTLEHALRNVFTTWVIRNKSKKIYMNTLQIWGKDLKYEKSYIIQWLSAILRKIEA